MYIITFSRQQSDYKRGGCPMLKKTAAAAIIILLLAPLIINAEGISQAIEVHRGDIGIIIDGRKTQLEEQPFIYNGRVYVPIRFISTAFGMDVDWNNEIRAVVINSPDYNFPLAECRPEEGEAFVYGKITGIDYENYTITIHQHFDDNSIPVDNPLRVNRDAIIVMQRDQRKNMHFYQLKIGSTGGFILDAGGTVRGIII
jgi:hypothetical protein